MFFEPERTQFDLNFRLFGIAVRVHPFFWLLSAMFGWDSVKEGFAYLLVWIGCVFVSVLIHEMGHVLMGRIFGTRGHIVLYSMGGIAIGSSNLTNRWQRIAVYFAGPLAQFLLLGVLLAVLFLSLGEREMSPLMAAVVNDLFWINLFWAALNLVPVLPLDGGQISREVFDWIMPGGQGLRTALGVSMVVAGVLAINSLAAYSGRPLIPFLPLGGLYMAIFFALLALTSFQMMQQVPIDRPRRDEDDRLPWERDADQWKRDPDRWER